MPCHAAVCRCIAALMLVFVAPLMLPAPLAVADTVLLGNGDRISGQILAITDGVLTVETEYAGTITITLDAVALVNTTDTRTLRLADGSAVTGRLVTDGATQELLTDTGATPLAWESVTRFAPDEESLLLAEAEAEEMAIAAATEAEAATRPRRWTGTVDAGATYRSGDINTLDANFKISATRQGEGRKLLLTGEASYGEADSQVTVRRYYGQARYEQHIAERIFAYGLTNLEQDAARGLDLRWGTAAGLGYDFIDRERVSLSADLGLSYRVEWWKQLPLAQERRARDGQRPAIFAETRALLDFYRTTPALSDAGLSAAIRYAQRVQSIRVRNPVDRTDGMEARLAARYRQELFSRSTLNNELVILPEIDDWGDLRAINELALSTPLSESLALRLSLKSEYDATPGGGLTDVDEWDHTFITALRYSF